MAQPSGARKRSKVGSKVIRAYSPKERLASFLALFDKDDTVLVMINADPDALACAMTVRRLLSYRVKSVTIGYPNEIRRLNNLTMVERLKIPIERLHRLNLKDYSKTVLLDSQPSHLPCFEKIQFDAVIDHHPRTEGWHARFADVRPEYGAVSSIMVEYLRAAGIEPSVALATALFYGIKVDTQNFELQAQVVDGIAFHYLFDRANRNLVRKFELSDLRRSELKYFKDALNLMQVNQRRGYVHLGRVRTPDVLVIIADFLNHVDGIDWVLVSGIHNERLVVIFRCDGYRKNAGNLARRVFGDLGPAGGHREAARAEVQLKNLPIRDQEFTTNILRRLATHHLD
ncbi:MAG: phosphoethanolamine methyltransferase [Desulfobulbaceae bacterium A2]|nr:MAG: phosphoethanolamine methyltransferase [Desulfobulbaceae bacterium A2]